MQSFMIILTAILTSIVAEVAYAAYWIRREVRSFFDEVLVPWMVNIHKEITRGDTE
jgi:hypothetical protein